MKDFWFGCEALMAFSKSYAVLGKATPAPTWAASTICINTVASRSGWG